MTEKKTSELLTEKDGDDLRLKDHWHALTSLDLLKDISQHDGESVLIVGYPDDEGVRLNGGRAGAVEGPSAILQYLGKMVVRDSPKIYVLESLPLDQPLAQRHEWAERVVTQALKAGLRVITMGGGHDYGYPDASAYMEVVKGKVLNIDAHLDMRPILQNQFNSGTPFRRLVERFGGRSLIQYGFWPHTNAVAHESFARKHHSLLIAATENLPPIEGPLGLSICLDAFTGIRGVSAPQIIGLPVERALDSIRRFRFQSQWLGLYEVAPNLDPITHDSGRLAAMLAYYFIHRSITH